MPKPKSKNVGMLAGATERIKNFFGADSAPPLMGDDDKYMGIGRASDWIEMCVKYKRKISALKNANSDGFGVYSLRPIMEGYEKTLDGLILNLKKLPKNLPDDKQVENVRDFRALIKAMDALIKQGEDVKNRREQSTAKTKAREIIKEKKR